MRIIDLENINYAMRNETQFVLHCEEVFHDKVSAAAAAILTGGRDQAHCGADGPLRLRQDHHRHAPAGLSGKPRREGLSAEYG